MITEDLHLHLKALMIKQDCTAAASQETFHIRELQTTVAVAEGHAFAYPQTTPSRIFLFFRCAVLVPYPVHAVSIHGSDKCTSDVRECNFRSGERWTAKKTHNSGMYEALSLVLVQCSSQRASWPCVTPARFNTVDRLALCTCFTPRDH
jgi:hypothetical protein